jgi:ATP-dependent protease Clp ATPase subunit
VTAIREPNQAMEALQRANDVRLRVAAFKREIAGLERWEAIVKVIDAIDARYNDPLLGAARVRHLLVGIAGIGDHKARKILTAAQVYNHDKRLRDLTLRQRKLLVGVLESAGWRLR